MKRLIFLIIILIPAVADAASYYVMPRLQSQVRENMINEREVPFTIFYDTGLADLPKEGSFDVSLMNNKIFNIPAENGDEFDLYQAVFRMNDIGNIIDISAGRQFLSPGFATYLVDGLKTTVGKDDWPVLISLLGGVPRYIETGDFHGEIGLLTGTTIELNGYDKSYARLSVLYDKYNIHVNEWKKNDTVLTGLALSHQFGGKVKPNIYGDFEFDTGGKDIDNSTAGIRLTPHRRFYCYAEGGFYNTNRDFRRPTIMGLFATGGLYQGRGGFQVIAVEANRVLGDLAINADYSFSRFDSGPGKGSNGNIAGAGLAFELIPLRMENGISYTFYDSYGGRAHDVLVALHSEPINKLSLDVSANYTKYTKITNDSDNAIGVFWMAGYEVLKNLILSAGGEYNRNDVFKKDIRATVQLAYLLRGKI